MKTKEIIASDVSKLVIDVCIYSTQEVGQFKNSKLGFKNMLKWVFKHSKSVCNQMTFIFENTGMYSHKLSVYLSDEELRFVVISGLELKRSMGITRGKDDQIDAKRIALYGYRLREELKPTKIPSKTLIVLKNLMSLRDKLVRQRAGYKSSLKEQKLIYKVKENEEFFSVQSKMIIAFTKQIKIIENRIKAIINENQDLLEIYKLVSSVKGIGHQTSLALLVCTDCFSKFKTWRKFASYCGIAPFPFQSGTSVRGRTKVSHLANKKIKSIINMCAISAIQHNPEMRAYYQKRISEGKNKMSTINIIRNKLISRVFAVVKRQTPYVDTMKYVA